MGRIFPGNICWCPRREDVLKISSGRFAKTSLKAKNCLEINKVFTRKEYTSVSSKS